jgi:hypothetical protein
LLTLDVADRREGRDYVGAGSGRICAGAEKNLRLFSMFPTFGASNFELG